MGLLIKLLAFPVMGPVKGLVWIAEKIAEQAENEIYDPDKVRGKLIELELRLDLGEITEEEYSQEFQRLQAQIDRDRNYPQTSLTGVAIQDRIQLSETQERFSE